MVNKTLGKKYLAEILKKRTGYSLLFSKKLIDDVLEIIKLQIKYNKEIFKKLGSFEILSKKKIEGTQKQKKHLKYLKGYPLNLWRRKFTKK